MNRDIVTGSVGILAGAGSGTRLGLGPKAFLELEGSTLLALAARQLLACCERVVVGVPPARQAAARKLLPGEVDVYAGKDSYQQTVAHLFEQAPGDLVLIHIVARPFATPDLIRTVLLAARDGNAAMATEQSRVPLSRLAAGHAVADLPRPDVAISQSPQAYSRETLANTLAWAARSNVTMQSPSQLVLARDIPIRCIPGEATNIKITTPLDWAIARDVIWPAVKSRLHL